MASEDRLRDYLKRATVDLTEARRRISELEEGRQEPIAITGMSCRYPGGGDTVEGFWDLLSEGRSGVVEVPASRWDIDDFYDPDRRAVGGMYTRHGSFLPDIAGLDAEFFGLSPQESLRMDPQQRLLLELVWEGLEDAGIAPPQVAGSRTAVMVGFMDSVQYGRVQTDRQGFGIVADPYFGQGLAASVVAGRLAYQFDLRGPTVTLDTACSSSLVGVHLAAQALRRGECDLAVAAGAFLIMRPEVYVQACATSMLAADGRGKTFDSGADGYVMGEGGGLVVLERLSSALRNGRRIRAVLRGSAVNQDGRSNGLTAPSRTAQVEVIRAAHAAARVAPDDVDYVEAHGSGTSLGDAIELSALHDVFGARPADRPLHVGAVKTNIGHTQAAAGVAGLIKTVLTMEHGEVPANLHCADPASAIPADGTVRPVHERLPLPRRGRRTVTGVSSFGWSGTNAHLVLETAPAAARRDEGDDEPGADVHTLAVSAASSASLQAQLARLAARLTGGPDLDLADVAHTLAVGRAQHDYRRAVICTEPDGAVAALRAAEAESARAQRTRSRPRVAFLLPGIGDHYAGMSASLYASEPVFAAAVDRCVAIVRDRCGLDLQPLLTPAADAPAPVVNPLDTADATTGPLARAEVSHPYVFTVEYALAALLRHWGVAPDLLVGYSLGEYVAACLAGVFTLEDALHLVVERARLIASAATGQMAAVAGSEELVRAAIAASGADVDVAAVNGPFMTVVSGPAGAVELLTQRLSADGTACRALRSAHAFHSTLLEPVRDKLAALIDAVPRQEPTIAIVSNRTGTVLSAREVTSSEHWADHLVQPVRFADGVRHCLEQGVDAFVELGGGQTLGGLVRQNLSAAPGVEVLGTLPAQWAVPTPGPLADSRSDLLRTCARLWELGVGVDWAATSRRAGRIVSLPTYAFSRVAFWPEQDADVTPLGAMTRPSDRCYAPRWQQDRAAARVRDARAPELTLPGPLVVYADTDGVGARLADLAAAAGVPVVEVVAGDALRHEGRRIVIDPAAPEHHREVLAAAAGQGPVTLVHLWSLLATAQQPVYATDGELRRALALGFDSLLLAVQALGDVSARGGSRLLTVSRGALEILGDDATAPYRAVGHGLGRAAQHEDAGLTWRGVDLDPDSLADAAAQLAHELRGAAPPAAQGGLGTVTAWRRGRRWLPDWAEVDVSAATDGSPWRADGAYLITGGTRGIGMALAKHLAGAGVRRLALVSRSRLREGDSDARTARSLADVAELEAAGAEVLLLTADAGDPDQLRGALRACRERFGPAYAVVHAAGTPAGGLVARRTVDDAGAVLAPKVLAMGPLAELVGPGTPAAERPELLVLYSSAVTAFGGIGESDYCAANTVLDAYGAALSAAAPSTRVVSVAWGPWQHDAWQGDGTSGVGGVLAERTHTYRRTYGFADGDGCGLLGRMVAVGSGSLLALRQPLHDVSREWSSMLDLDALVGDIAATATRERFARPQLRTEYVAPRSEREALVADVWGSFLGIDAVGVNDPFFDLGGNSLVGMAMVHAVEKQLDTTIAPAVLFEHPTVAQFAAALDDDAGGRAAEDLLTSSARGQRRRRARPAGRKGGVA